MMREERAMICVCGKGITLLIGGAAPTHVHKQDSGQIRQNAFRSATEEGFRPVEKAEH
jgi:hypothetical protein